MLLFLLSLGFWDLKPGHKEFEAGALSFSYSSFFVGMTGTLGCLCRHLWICQWCLPSLAFWLITLRQGLSQDWSLAISSSLVVHPIVEVGVSLSPMCTNPQLSSFLSFFIYFILFDMGVGDLNSGLPICTASPFTIKTLLLVPCFYIYFKYVCTCVWVQVPLESRRGQTPWSWSSRHLWATWYGCWETNPGLLQSSKQS